MNSYKYSMSILALIVIGITGYGFSSLQDDPKKPEDNRFTKVVLAPRLEEPMQFQILNDGRVIFAERKGKLKVYNPTTGQVKIIADIPVSTKYVSKTGEVTEGEDGLQGVILDPGFETNHWIYLYFATPGDPKNVLARYEWDGNDLNLASKKILMEVPVQREECCHVGGGMLFDKQGNLYLSTGDNTFSRASDGYTPIDEQPGESPRDAQKSSGNTNDLRGKILRITPHADGTYSIPEGNLFPKGTDKTRPEIYTMGNRNPWRLTIDSKTGWLYWGEVGPDGSNEDLEKRGPKSHDEFNQAKKAGNYGWPYFAENNVPYVEYDFATKTSGKAYDPAKPINNSPNNTGLTELPPTTPAFIWYSKDESKEFPSMGGGGNSAVGGPIYHRSDFKNPKRAYPAYFEGKWLITDWVRGWMLLVSIDENGNYKSMERFLPNTTLRGPIDMKFGPDGDLYILEYGNGYFNNNPEAALVKIEYNGGNRKPAVKTSSSKMAGSVPLKIRLSSTGTTDADGDVLKYQWKITKKGLTPKLYNQANPVITLNTPGFYQALLTVTDIKGEKNSSALELVAGNEPPELSISLTGGNKTFFFPNREINYAVNVTDKEDGSLANKKIVPSQVAVSIDYMPEGYDFEQEIAQSHRTAETSVQFAGAQGIMAKSDCKSCHNLETKSLGPAFLEVAKKYKDDADAPNRLTKKIIEGGSGVWGDAMMPAHPTVPEKDIKTIVNYILQLYQKQPVKLLPVKGTYITKVPEGDNGKGSVIFRAAYNDRGNGQIPSQSSESISVLRQPVLSVSKTDKSSGIKFNNDRSRAVAIGPMSYLNFNKIDLSGIKNIDLELPGEKEALGGLIEIRQDSPTGKLIGQTETLNGTKKETIKVGIAAEPGLRTVCILLKNPKAGLKDKLLQIRTIRFNEN
ncbi:MAG: PQQ-dependent sugar dehydrogenase [Sphingobacteriaceae bacterium]